MPASKAPASSPSSAAITAVGEPVAQPSSRFRAIWIALPWLLALAYLSALGWLGQAFHEIQPWELTQLSETGREAVDEPIGQLLRIAPAGPVTVTLATRFDSPPDAGALALLVPRSSSDLTVKVNGSTVRMASRPTRQRNDYRPLLVDLPADRLTPDGTGNVLELTLVSHSGVQVLSQLYLGPRAQLQPVYQQFFWFRQHFPRIALGITLLLGSAMLIMWGLRRRLAEYGWLGLAFLAFSYYLFSLISYQEPANLALYTWSFLLARAGFILAFLLFAHRFLGLHRRWLELTTAALLTGVFVAGLYPALTHSYGALMTLTLFTSLPLVLGLIVYLALVFLNELKSTSHVYLHWLAVGALMGVLLGTYDVLVLLDIRHPLIVDFYVSHYAIIFSCIGAGAVQVHRMARALLDSEDLNRTLNRELAARSQALEAAAEARLSQEKHLALARERQRIMADMHDGVGGQLVSLLAANQSRKLTPEAMDTELASIFADLRLVLDVLSPAGDDLIQALARLRQRLQGLLLPSGIALKWEIDEQLQEVPLLPAQTVNVLRLVQEAIQNAVKHGKARQIDVSLRQKDQVLTLSVTDDGSGFDPDSAVPGQGLNSLKRRANALAGTLRLTSQPGEGTRVTLTFNLKTPKNLGDQPRGADKY